MAPLFASNGSSALFGMQLLVSGVGMVLSAGMLLMGRDPAIYLPIVTSIIGYWLPAPRAPPPPSVADEAHSSVASMNGSLLVDEKKNVADE